MEARLKEDILQEAARYMNKVMVSDELPDGQMIDQWEQIGQDCVQTPLEVYESLQAEGYQVDYERIPITDEKSPKERDFDLLVSASANSPYFTLQIWGLENFRACTWHDNLLQVQRLSQVDVGTRLVFNCQMGRGRTTTGMVVATLIHLRRIGATGLPRSSSMGQILEAPKEVIYDMPDSEEALRRGEYTVIRSLIRVLEVSFPPKNM
jgi:hypothetical protein